MGKAKTVKIKVKKSQLRQFLQLLCEAVETDPTLNEEGLDAVADFLKSVAEEKPVPKTLEERQLSLFWEPPIVPGWRVMSVE